MPIFRDENHTTASPAATADELSRELVRAFVAVGLLLGDVGQPAWTPAEVEHEVVRRLQRRLHDFVVVFGAENVADSLLVLAEAIDDLGGGETLDVDALARLWSACSAGLR